jgi:hypothetical protein
VLKINKMVEISEETRKNAVAYLAEKKAEK